jgi:hypothetical protein
VRSESEASLLTPLSRASSTWRVRRDVVASTSLNTAPSYSPVGRAGAPAAGVEHAESAADFGRAAREGAADVWLYDTFAGLPGVGSFVPHPS